jgi:hypothetical protein
MSRRNYVATAEIIATAPVTPLQHAYLADRFCEYFEADNPRFDPVRFRQACAQQEKENVSA